MYGPDPTFNFEVIKLLLQAAWADLELQPAEARLIQSRARALLCAEDAQLVEACLRGQCKLPPPDIGLLRLHRERVVQMVRELLVSDAAMVPDEQELLQEIETLLRG